MFGLVALVLGAAIFYGGMPVSRLYGKLFQPLWRLTLAIAVGLLVGIFIETANLTAKLGRVFAPFLRFGHLKEPSALAFTTAFFSAAAASSILMNAYQEGGISRRELIISALLLTFPAFFAHLPSMFFTITPLVGVLGGYYLAILLGGDLLRTLVYLCYCRLTLPPYVPCPQSPIPRKNSWKQVWLDTRDKFLTRLYNILVITIPVFVAVFLAQEMGLFDQIRGYLAMILKGSQIPVEAVSILIFSLAAEVTGGFAAAGALLASQALSPGVILFTLILGSIIASPMRAVRHQLPYYLGIYTPALGLKIMVLSQLFRILSLVPFMAVIYWWAF